MFEISWRLDAITNRKNNEYKFQASLHRIELKTPSLDDYQEVNLKQEEQSKIERAKREALERIRLRHGK